MFAFTISILYEIASGVYSYVYSVSSPMRLTPKKKIIAFNDVPLSYSVRFFFPGGCEFPAQWSGRWFQSGVKDYININTTSITTKGVCLMNINDKFLIEDR